jgi:formamidopyrimidine-DNA glycosylase
MPELPEVETVRRMLASVVPGRTVARAEVSGAALRGVVPRSLPRCLGGRTFLAPRRVGKYLLLDLDGGLTLLSHLGMSGRWLFWSGAPDDSLPHVHARLTFRDGTRLWFQDPRRFGVLRLLPTDGVERAPELRALGPDPLADPPTGERLAALARGTRVSVKQFLLDQRRLAGVGNIYASEVLFRARISPRRRAGALDGAEWRAVARETMATLGEAIERMGTTFSAYRTLWGEPGAYGEHLFVYDRAREPCRVCGATIRRIVQGQRSTYYCPRCQRGRAAAPRREHRAARGRTRGPCGTGGCRT